MRDVLETRVRSYASNVDGILPPFIIEQIRKREQAERERRQENERSIRIDDSPPEGWTPDQDSNPEDDGGVVIIQLRYSSASRYN